MTRSLELVAIHKDDLDFYQSLLGDELKFSSKDEDWYFVKDSFFELTDEQYAIMLLRDPDFMTWEEQDAAWDKMEYNQRRNSIMAERNARKLARILRKQAQATI